MFKCHGVIEFAGIDNTPPIITGCPFRVGGMANLGTNEGVATWTEPIAADDDGQPVLVARTHAPSSLFPVGPTTVAYYFTDSTGNEAICSFMVIIIMEGTCSFCDFSTAVLVS